MNALAAHIEFVEAHSHDKTAAAALVDHLHEERGMSRREALRYVATIRRPNRKHRQWGKGAYLVGKCCPLRNLFRSWCGRKASVSLAADFSVIVVTGYSPPTVKARAQPPVGSYLAAPVVFVGCGALLVYARAYLKRAGSLSADEVRCKLAE